MEKLVIKYWLKPLVTEDIFKDQFAFIPLQGRGTQSILTIIYGKILELKEKRNCFNAVLIDFSKAFDKVQPTDILNSLYQNGAPKESLYWIKSYLTDRGHCVSTNNEVSNVHNVHSGVPQGSVLGPLLFAFVISTLTPSSNNNNMYYKYADDLTILSKANLQEELNHIENWCKENSMTINIEKTKIIHFCSNKNNNCCDSYYTLYNQRIDYVNESKLLGLIISNDLKWNSFVNNSVKKASKLVFLIVQLKRANVSKDNLWKIYNIFIRCHLTYACLAWCNLPSYLLQNLAKFEKKISIIIGSKPEENIIDFMDRLNKKMAENIIINKDHPIRQLLIYIDNQRSTRHSNSIPNLIIPYCSTSLRLNSFFKFFL
jgi:hypothetical protein